MRLSLVVRLTLIVAGTIALSFLSWLWIVHRSASSVFLEVQTEVRTEADDRVRATELAETLERAYTEGGWDAVRRIAQAPSAAGPVGPVAFLVVDDALRVAVATQPAWVAGTAREEPDGGLTIRAETTTDGEVAELELTASDPPWLSSPTGAPWGRLVVLPAVLDREEGQRFAARVWKSAALWLAVVVLCAMGITAWVLRRSLAPIDRLTAAAVELQAGRMPAPLRRDGSAEFGNLIEAFNSATESIHRTEQLRKRLISDIAHELRTPVTNVKGQLEAVQQGLIRPDAEFVETLQAETRLLERLVEDFHELALSDAGQLRLELQDLPLCEVLRNVLAPLVEAAGGELEVEGPDDLQVHVDEERMRQILSNLTENAARHRPEGLRLQVVARADGEFATFEVRDNGPGVAELDRAHIFERFYRAEKSRNRATGGAGLGLAIVKGLVEAMGGSIRYVDRNEGGATFAISLPRAKDEQGD